MTNRMDERRRHNAKRTLDADTRELVCRMFVVATLIAAEAHEIAVAGQSPKRTAAGYRKYALRIRSAASDMTAVADAVIVVAMKQGREPEPRARRNKRSSK